MLKVSAARWVWFSVALGCVNMATAAPILGTTTPFFSSPFCKAFKCNLPGIASLGRGITEYRYPLGELTISGMDKSQPIVVVLRQANRVISASVAFGGQDVVLAANSDESRVVSSLVESMTGRRPSDQNLYALNEACINNAKRETSLPWIFGGKTSRLACLTSPEYNGANRMNFSVYLP